MYKKHTHLFKHNHTICLLLGILILISSANVLAEFNKKVIMKSGDPAHGTDGAVFSNELNPKVICLAESGKVLFRGYLQRDGVDVTDENDMGLWVYEGDSLRLIGRRGGPVPGMPGMMFRKDSQLYLEGNMDRNGKVSLDAFYSPDGTFVDEEHGFFMEENGEMVLKLYAGLEVAPGAAISAFVAGAFNNGYVVFSCFLEGPSVTYENNRAYCIFGPEGVTVLARYREPMHLISGDWINHNISMYNDTMPLTAYGETIFQIWGYSTNLSASIGAVYKWSPDDGFSLLRSSHIDSSITTVFGNWRMDSDGYWTSTPLSQWPYTFNIYDSFDELIATVGDIAPGGGGATFSNFVSSFAALDNWEVVFSTTLSNNKRGIWMGDRIDLRKVVMKDDWVPGVTDSIQFGDIKYWMPNSRGQVAVANTMPQPPYFTYTAGIWMFNPDGSSEPITYRGETIDVASDGTRTINRIYTGLELTTGQDEFPISSGTDGFPAKTNNSGQLAFSSSFQEGGFAVLIASSGIVVNSNSDAPDADSTDGVCDTGEIMPDGKPECTLRAAITEANAQEGYNQISFDIEEDPYIEPESPLPEVKESVLIDGFSQPGDNLPTIIGDFTDFEVDGLVLKGRDITVQGLNIGGFDGDGISIVGGEGKEVSNNKVFGCYVGYYSTTGSNYGNGDNGIEIQSSSNNIIGGQESWQRNYISSNVYNGISLSSANSNRIENNYIGWTPSNQDYSNGWNGIYVSHSDSNIIGGNDGAGNVIRGNGMDGIQLIFASQTVIYGNRIGKNSSDGVEISHVSNGTRLFNNIIGLDENGEWDGNLEYGVLVHSESDSCYIGGASDSGNVISFNGKDGVKIDYCTETKICGNKIGTNLDATWARGNGGNGILIDGCVGTKIGEYWSDQFGGLVGAGNLISGNDSSGVKICDESSESRDNIIASNLIGVGLDSVYAIPNYKGVQISSSSHNYIGGVEPLSPLMGNVISENTTSGVELIHGASENSINHNTISGNGDDGIFIEMSLENIVEGNEIGNNWANGIRVDEAAFENRIIGNIIGLNGDNELAGNSEYGVLVDNSSMSNFIGGGADSGNVISGNGWGGIRVEFSDDNTIGGNYIGTDLTGLIERANHGVGVLIDGSDDTHVGKRWSDLDQAYAGAGNVISGNDSVGVMVVSEASQSYDNVIVTNLIGVGVDASTPIPNKLGIVIVNATRTLIGGGDPSTILLGNKIKENLKSGIRLETDSCYVGSNIIENNGFGPDNPPGEPGGAGVFINGYSNTVAASAEWPIQTIKNNNGVGVRIYDSPHRYNRYNRIQFNSISGNVFGGIDIDPAGPNPNDNLDGDFGPNDKQNAPEILSATVNVQGHLLLAAQLNSEPNEWYELDVFGNDECDALGLGQGDVYLFSDSLYTDASGEVEYEYVDTLFAGVQSFITMTVTDSKNNTSEFSNCMEVVSTGVDLRISKTDNIDTTIILDTLCYSMIVTNYGPEIANNVIVLDSLPMQISYISDTISQGTSALIDNAFTCNIGDLTPGATASIKIVALADSLGEIVNWAKVSTTSPEMFLLNNTGIDTTVSREDYVCGDANGDGGVNISDAVYIINCIFRGGPCAEPDKGGDPNCDGTANISDGVYLINLIFRGGPDPCAWCK